MRRLAVLSVLAILVFVAVISPTGGKQHMFSIVHIPDTHYDYMLNEQDFNAIADWIVANKEARNIQLVIHSGDVGDERGTGGLEGTLSSARTILDRVNNAGIPLLVAIGNHDYDNALTVNRSSTLFNTYFGIDMYSANPWFGGTCENKSENIYLKTEIQGRKFLFLALEFGPRDKVLRWANDVVAAHRDHRIIIVTHSYLNNTGERQAPGQSGGNPKNYAGTSTTPGDEYTNDGEDMWQKFVRHHPNILSVHSGHRTNFPTMTYQVSTGVNGNKVYEFFNNWQNIVFKSDGTDFAYWGDQPSYVARASMIRIFTYDLDAGVVEIENLVVPIMKEGQPSDPECFDLQALNISLKKVQQQKVRHKNEIRSISTILVQNNGRLTPVSEVMVK